MVYAVDFDGTLCSNRWPDIGEPNSGLIEFLKKEREKGEEVVLFTMREGLKLDEALIWCELHGLTFTAVNDNTKTMKELFNNNPRKVYADVYIDDHNADGGFFERFKLADLPYIKNSCIKRKEETHEHSI